MATYSPEEVKELFEEIAKLKEEVKHYKRIWKKAESNYEYMFDRHKEKEKIIKQSKMFEDLMIDYCLEQKRLHVHNHNHCVKQVVNKVPDEDLQTVSAAFEARLKDRCNEKEPGLFELVMQSLNIESSVKG